MGQSLEFVQVLRYLCRERDIYNDSHFTLLSTRGTRTYTWGGALNFSKSHNLSGESSKVPGPLYREEGVCDDSPFWVPEPNISSYCSHTFIYSFIFFTYFFIFLYISLIFLTASHRLEGVGCTCGFPIVVRGLRNFSQYLINRGGKRFP